MTLSVSQTFLATVFILGVGTFILLASSAFIGYAAAQRQFAQGKATVDRFPWYLLAVMAVWFAVAMATSLAGLISLPLVLPFALIPIIGGTLVSFLPQVKALIQAIPTHWLIFLQAYRFAGVIFIYPYMAEGILTRGFALNAGIGDMITGFLAVPVAWLVMRGGSRYKWLFLFWTAFGILDLIVAPASAAYYGFNVSGLPPQFPITTIPLFFGPPFGVLIHIITLRSFWLRYISESSSNGQVEAYKSLPNQSTAWPNM